MSRDPKSTRCPHCGSTFTKYFRNTTTADTVVYQCEVCKQFFNVKIDLI